MTFRNVSFAAKRNSERPPFNTSATLRSEIGAVLRPLDHNTGLRGYRAPSTMDGEDLREPTVQSQPRTVSEGLCYPHVMALYQRATRGIQNPLSLYSLDRVLKSDAEIDGGPKSISPLCQRIVRPFN